MNGQESLNTSTESSKVTRFLYNNKTGRILLKLLVKPAISKMVGAFMDTKVSTIFIQSFIRKNNIDMQEYEERKYVSYNDFFTRKVKAGKRKIDYETSHFIAPCDSRLLVYKIEEDVNEKENQVFDIKGSKYRVEDLLNDKKLAGKYANGYCMIFRLSVDDYHRYCYIDNGKKGNNVYIKGELHTVRPIALERYNIYKRNCREYTVLNTENFGDVCQIEVGAMLVGKIKNMHEKCSYNKGEEKGMFEFGGSTIVLLVEKNKVNVDSNILKKSNLNIETRVKMGERIGVRHE